MNKYEIAEFMWSGVRLLKKLASNLYVTSLNPSLATLIWVVKLYH